MSLKTYGNKPAAKKKVVNEEEQISYILAFEFHRCHIAHRGLL